MASEYRQGEVLHIGKWYENNGYHLIHQTNPPVALEGMGDGRHPSKKKSFTLDTDFAQVKMLCKGPRIVFPAMLLVWNLFYLIFIT